MKKYLPAMVEVCATGHKAVHMLESSADSFTSDVTYYKADEVEALLKDVRNVLEHIPGSYDNCVDDIARLLQQLDP